MSYVDTSLIVAALDPLDPRRGRAREVLDGERDKVVSELVLVELASVLSRRGDLVSSIASKLGLSREETVIAVILYLLKRFNLRYRSVEGRARLTPLGRLCRPVAIAMELSPALGLKTLDLLHVAYAKLMREEGEPMQKLITADEDFEKVREKLREITGIDPQVV